MKKETEVFKEARRLHALGFAIHWVEPKSKKPVGRGWTTGPRKTWEQLAVTYCNGLNVGVRLGTPSQMGGGYLCVIDVDIKSGEKRHREEARNATRSIINPVLFPMVRSGRGGGSKHYYCLTATPFKGTTPYKSAEKVKYFGPSKSPSKIDRAALSEKEIAEGWRMAAAWEISFMSDGRHVVIPPSIHPDSGELYAWARDVTAVSQLPLSTWDTTAVPVLPGKTGETVIAGNAGEAGKEAIPQPGSMREALGGGLSQAKLEGFQVQPVDLGWTDISAEVRAGILEGTGVTDRSGYLLKASSALFSAGLERNEVLTVLTDPKTFLGACSYEHAKTKNRRRAAEWVYRYTVERVARERSGEGVFNVGMPKPRKLSPEEMARVAAEFQEERDWRQDLDLGEKGKLRVTLKNLDLILSNEVHQNVFIEDLFATRIEYGADTPWGGVLQTPIRDIDMIRIKRWFADSFAIEPNTAIIMEATSLIADRCGVHPVRDWLEKLTWDGTSRINGWLKDYCEAEAEEPYLSQVSRKFLLAMVTRIFRPGCQWDYMLVLEGLQGQKKSTIARTIASDRWFMDNLPDLKDKDSMLNLQGKWLIELPELASIKHTDFNHVKAYISRRVDTVRPHYGRLKADVPRQSVFIGTVNEGQYFKDPTGNRRYWPVKVGKCDVEGLTKVRDQLFAEAMVIYREASELLMLDPRSESQAKNAQEHRRVDDDETEMREAFLSFRDSPEAAQFDFDRFKTHDLMTGVNAPWGRWNARGGFMAQVAAQVLTNLGYSRHKIGGQRYWKPVGQASKGLLPHTAPLPQNEKPADFH